MQRLQRQLESAQSDQQRFATEARAANDAKHALQLQNDRNAAKVSDLEATVESLRRRLSAADEATEKQHATAQRHATELETLRSELLLKSKSNAQLHQEVDDANQAREHALDRAQQGVYVWAGSAKFTRQTRILAKSPPNYALWSIAVAKEASSVRMQVADLTHQLQDARQQLDAQQKRFDAQRYVMMDRMFPASVLTSCTAWSFASLSGYRMTWPGVASSCKLHVMNLRQHWLTLGGHCRIQSSKLTDDRHM